MRFADWLDYWYETHCKPNIRTSTQSGYGAFARPVRANQGYHFSLAALKVNILCHNRLTKRVVQLFHFQNNLAGCRRRDFCLLDLVQVRSAKPQRPDFLIGQDFHLLRGKFPHNFPFLHTQETVCQIH